MLKQIHRAELFYILADLTTCKIIQIVKYNKFLYLKVININ